MRGELAFLITELKVLFRQKGEERFIQDVAKIIFDRDHQIDLLRAENCHLKGQVNKGDA